MAVAGIDAGSATTKAAIVKNGELSAYAIVPTGANGRNASAKALEEALALAKLTRIDLTKIVSTGYGRRNVEFAENAVTEITTHAKGAKTLFPSAMTIIDIGGQDSKVISLDEDGRINNFVMNDKCAAGTGRFLEVMARTLEVALQDLGKLSISAEKPAKISSMCTVFAESEVVSLIAQGEKREAIIAGLHEAISKRIAGMVKQVGLRREVVFTGGVAKNVGMKASLERVFGLKINIPAEPQIIGAFGAALIAEEGTIIS
ncbi:MAG: acyl-CoA dehydratase activase [Candidatus Bathyarchaeota archaeon]|nr:acyl-CoA dehydratase activase [Candidatus Bathyarchaeota archaeon]